ncbi:uncharacterized protein J3R85_020474 [Psidium guajava]|nr:uncharacterized protein J3R85_020474 [Psidium guajava]
MSMVYPLTNDCSRLQPWSRITPVTKDDQDSPLGKVSTYNAGGSAHKDILNSMRIPTNPSVGFTVILSSTKSQELKINSRNPSQIVSTQNEHHHQLKISSTKQQ